jgi:hypothetical protein
MNKSRIVLTTALVCLLFSLLFSKVAYSQQVRDRKKNGDDDLVVVPKGTRIQTDLAHSSQGSPTTPYEFEGKIEIPVRLGFTTAIPAGAKITVLVTSRYDESTYQEPSYRELIELLDVTIDGKVYNIRTDRIPAQVSTAKEIAFTLLEPLEIHR